MIGQYFPILIAVPTSHSMSDDLPDAAQIIMQRSIRDLSSWGLNAIHSPSKVTMMKSDLVFTGVKNSKCFCPLSLMQIANGGSGGCKHQSRMRLIFALVQAMALFDEINHE